MALLISVLKDPALSRALRAQDWDLLIRQARHANLLGRLHGVLEEAGDGLFAAIPERARNHLVSGAAMADRQRLSIRHEAELLRETFAARGLPLILLKGAAYVLAGLPAASGRIFADIDILVPRAALAEAESALMQTGWVSTATDAYDERYYREWMHELPAMTHMFRGTALDVHHTILPPTSRLKPDPAQLIAASVEIADAPGMRVLCPCDMVLHSATHLFHEGEPDNLLRDLCDLDALLRFFAADADFAAKLAARAELLGLVGPLRLALRYTKRLLDTPLPAVPGAALEPLSATRQALLDALYARVLMPQHESTADAFSGLARKFLYVRAHWLRMPPHRLAFHLAHKALFPPKPPQANGAK